MKSSVRQEPKRIIVKIRVFPDEDTPKGLTSAVSVGTDDRQAAEPGARVT
jgi:hypothetical protein